jgi:hypothetical protein
MFVNDSSEGAGALNRAQARSAVTPPLPPSPEAARAQASLKVMNAMTASPPPSQSGAASLKDAASHERCDRSDRSPSNGREGDARSPLKAAVITTPPPGLIDEIRLNYRLAKSAEAMRIAIDQKLISFARVYLTAWTPDGEELTRTKANTQAKRVVDAALKGQPPTAGDEALYAAMVDMVNAVSLARAPIEARYKMHRKAVEKAAKTLPAWELLAPIRGFSVWGFGAVIGEAGDIGMYSGCRKIYKRLGLAPDECYPKGEKKTGRMIPRMARGRVMGIIADPLFRAQWRGERDDAPAHAIGPFGEVYIATKTRALESGKTKGHADKLGRRAMVKALLHSVHDAWHKPPKAYSAYDLCRDYGIPPKLMGKP